ncbi:MAG: class I SAM-dependent methyltransferase [Casimicrobiaceae bacterium]
MATTYGDEFYRDILEGLAIYHGSAFQRDVLATLSTWQLPGIGVALNKNQIASKMWLADVLLDTVGPRIGMVTVLGGWVGVLAAVLLHDPRFRIGRVVSTDIDPGCAAVAEALNATHVRAGRFAAETADMLGIDYAALPIEIDGAPCAIVNTSAEHLPDVAGWYARIPSGRLMVLQSNDYFACAEHVSSVPDLAAFRAQIPMADVLFAGERRMRHYTRFMLVGRK